MTELIFEGDDFLRLDRYLSLNQPDLSRSYIAKQIESGLIQVNDTLAKPSLKLKYGDKISFDSKKLIPGSPVAIQLPILYEDDFCIVINKPSGIITHAKGVMSDEPSVASFIHDKLDKAMSGNRAGIVHRLDRGTSGAIIAAKTPQAMIYLQRQFAKRQTKKTYLALVEGPLKRNEAIITMPIERNPKHPSTFKVGPNGKSAETYYKLIQTSDSYSLLKLQPKTGRTHQLRVHLKAIDHPIVGDAFYDGSQADRLMLHAYELEVILPNQGRVSFKAPVPKEFSDYITDLPLVF